MSDLFSHCLLVVCQFFLSAKIQIKELACLLMAENKHVFLLMEQNIIDCCIFASDFNTQKL